MRYLAVYVRVSSRRQDHRSQVADLERWVAAYADGRPVKWFRDKATGRNMDRPAWKRLEAEMEAGNVDTLLCWRLDRLGRTCSGLVTLFDRLRERKVRLVSIRDGVDLGTASGRMMAGVLASIASYENEVRAERILAGQAVARANGKRWGGRKPGTRIRVTVEAETIIRRMHREGSKIAAIARAVGLSRPTIYAVLER